MFYANGYILRKVKENNTQWSPVSFCLDNLLRILHMFGNKIFHVFHR